MTLMTSKKTQQTAYIANHIHWGREWRYPIWETRFMLVEFMDELITLLERGAYASFFMDGQVSPILDYLRVRPEMECRIKTLVSAGKLEIGPWYTLPDEFPIDGESLVRNLRWGIRHCRRLGGELRVGYPYFWVGTDRTIDTDLCGIGMDTAFVGKRVEKTRVPKSEFFWKVPDGSTRMAGRFGAWGCQNLYGLTLQKLINLSGGEHLFDL